MHHNSQKAGCIFLSPASHCCHTRHVVCTMAAAWVWVSPASCRAARICAGVGGCVIVPLSQPCRPSSARPARQANFFQAHLGALGCVPVLAHNPSPHRAATLPACVEPSPQALFLARPSSSACAPPGQARPPRSYGLLCCLFYVHLIFLGLVGRNALPMS